MNFVSSETRRIALPEAGNYTIVSSFVWTQYRDVSDGETKGYTGIPRTYGPFNVSILLNGWICLHGELD